MMVFISAQHTKGSYSQKHITQNHNTVITVFLYQKRKKKVALPNVFIVISTRKQNNHHQLTDKQCYEFIKKSTSKNVLSLHEFEEQVSTYQLSVKYSPLPDLKKSVT